MIGDCCNAWAYMKLQNDYQRLDEEERFGEINKQYNFELWYGHMQI